MSVNIETLYYEGKEIKIVGTAHISPESVKLVKQVIDDTLPDTVCVELDASRYDTIQNPKQWEDTNVIEIIKSKKVGLLLANLLLSSYQKNLAKKLNTASGQEMIQGIKSAKEHGCELVLADREVQTTFLRIWRKLPIRHKIKLLIGILFDFKSDEDVGEDDIAALMQKDNLEAAISAISGDFPIISEILIHERDQYLAHKIKNASGEKIVAVLGAAHVAGVKKEILCQQNIQDISSIPPKSIFTKVSAWVIPAVIVFLLLYGFMQNFQTGVQQLTSWVFWNGIAAALFTAVL